MKVLVAQTCGFCNGVRNAIRMAEKVLAQHRQVSCGEKKACSAGAATKAGVYSLGPIIHNSDMVQHLAKAGLKTVNKVEEIQSGTVIIRSHGAAPQQKAALKEKGLKIVDATCVLVKRLQHIAKQLKKDGYKVVIIGDENHPEVQAVVGSARDVYVIADKRDLNKLPKNTKLGIVCQTTESPQHVGRMLAAIDRSSFSEVKVINTLCKEAIKRQESAVQLCKQVDIMFVLGGLESANTRKLAELCKKVNKQTFHLQNWNELDKSILLGNNIDPAASLLPSKTAGVTAGASTPQWIIDEFVKNLQAL